MNHSFIKITAIVSATCWLMLAIHNHLYAQQDLLPVAQQYSKTEYRIRMRDGVHLHTVVFAPRDRSKTYPIILNRTPYSCQPYGLENYPNRIGPEILQSEGYIFVKQDVRGRWMSEGTFDNMRPHVSGTSNIDESSDTYDTIQWLMDNLDNHNGKVGIMGISYPGFYAAAALPEAHPALVASSPQAPIADFYFDDFHHHGAFTLMYWIATATFGYQHNGPTTQAWYRSPQVDTRDAYQFYLDLGPLKNTERYYGKDNFFWQQIVEHPNYDEFWQRRSILPHLKNIGSNVMVVGGWFDAEDLYGPLQIFKTIEENNAGIYNVLVMGPWGHGDWARAGQHTMVGNIVFGERISDWYQREIEAPFFRHFLKEQGELPAWKALVFDTGRNEWKAFDAWPPRQSETTSFYLGAGKKLTMSSPDEAGSYSEFTSDPNSPVPYRQRDQLTIRFTPRPYMTDDQRFASNHPDVLVFESDILSDDITLAGDIHAHLLVSTDQTDADWIVKLIDVYPADTRNHSATPPSVSLAGYQQMVRSEIFRGRFRNSYSAPEPFVPNEVTPVTVPLQDVFHTFKRGHRIMVHVQSSWFPLFDRNPQKYVNNIYKASASDFSKATRRVFHNKNHASRLEFRILRGSQAETK